MRKQDRGNADVFADFADLDGNRWVLQERGYRQDAGTS